MCHRSEGESYYQWNVWTYEMRIVLGAFIACDKPSKSNLSQQSEKYTLPGKPVFFVLSCKQIDNSLSFNSSLLVIFKRNSRYFLKESFMNPQKYVTSNTNVIFHLFCTWKLRGEDLDHFLSLASPFIAGKGKSCSWKNKKENLNVP